jgi:hypothetical protein
METSTDVVVLRVPARFRIIGWVMIAVTLVGVAGIVWLIFNGGAVMAFLAFPLLVLVSPLWTVLPNVLGNRASRIDADGILTRIRPWDLRRTRIPWADVSGVWVAPIGQLRYLHVGLHDPARYITGGRLRRTTLETLLDAHGTPVPVYLHGDEEPALAAVEWFSRETVPVLDGRPVPDGRPETEPVPVPHREYRAAPRALLLPAALLVTAVALGWLGWTSTLFSLVGFAACPLLFAILMVLRLPGRTVLDESGFTVGNRHLPWSDLALVRFVAAGPVGWVQIVRHQGETLLARGLVDQPPRDPRYTARLAEVEAACAGRVGVARRRQGQLGALILIALLPVALATLQLVTVDRPWRDRPWWPGVEVATATPDPCAALSTVEARRLVPDGAPRAASDDAGSPSRRCRLGSGVPQLEVGIDRASYGDLIAEGRDDFDRTRRLGSGVEPVPGLGEEAFTGTYGASIVRVVARRGNVVVEVQFTPGEAGSDRGTPAYAANEAAAIEVARAAVDAVDLR